MRNIAIPILFVLANCTNEKLNDNQQERIEKRLFNTPSVLLDTPSQFFEVSTLKDTVLTGKENTQITIKAKGVRTDEETIKVELKEYYNFPNMLMKGLSTTSDNKILETGGMLYLNITTLSGTSVQCQPNGCSVEVPLNFKDGAFTLFSGTDTGNNINWKLNENTGEMIEQPIILGMDSEGIVYMPDTAGLFYQFNNLGAKWINVDKFLEYENKTDLIVQLPEGQEGAVYSLTFYSFNSILPGIPDDKGQFVFKGIPAGEKVTLIALGAKEDELFFSYLDLTTDTKGAKLPPLKPISKEELKEILGKKFGNSLDNRPKPMF